MELNINYNRFYGHNSNSTIWVLNELHISYPKVITTKAL